MKDKTRRDAQMTVVVAGGAGFLGSHLCARFLDAGHQVICVDNFLTGHRANIAPLRVHPGFQLITHDITAPLDLPGPVDQIYNMACAASPVGYQRDPVHTMMTNVNGARHLLDLARAKGARILQASTSEVYGDPEVPLQSEDYRGAVKTCGPRACYDEGKRAAETLFWDYHQSYGVETRIARIFNTYGPRMHPHDGRVISNFIRQALAGEPMTVYGTGQQSRAFCYVTDLIEGLVRLMNADEVMPVNFGNPDEFTIVALADMVREKTKTRSQIVHVALPQDDPQQRRPDISRAQHLLDWQPVVPLEQGLDRMIAWFSRAPSDATRVS